ncbi:M20 metallopeptidase family protein [Enterococcus columbae]|uniref:Peptidase M20 dimerisation domain-containing protein n=1 Tax=Enterococcus columbae DSM 7374 = ATCC 51263 TaxID=1121865 RepID=S1NIB2_9ENTE|nr:amidohydrolase [Enterococcus columbae]EOT41982.1 hypothetical protein OMW_01096 [Enterococcus columbae DSM 7374 = ATCC 51263]EOW80539.1 hypothetical protein I568_01716 [Enterococcus columbae DSM 7374 = ATCC 51263]OJG26386.1 hypothetical protein RR47_GL000134 [Enterococcus columbae DSM 7374 = ATCC 51263]
MQISADVRRLLPNVVAHRRALHQIPELGLAEYKTKAYLQEQLSKLPHVVIHEILDTGLIAIFKGKQPGKTLGFRTDIDALPITEETNVAFSSTHPNCMHACGHDGHMATMLGFAEYLATHPEEIIGTIVLVFQPAEEGPGGAQLLIDAGLFEQYPIEQMIGLHVFPEFEEGIIACKPGAMMARNGEVTIEIIGKSAHGAQPQIGADALLASAAVIQGLHSIISRNLSPLDSAVLTFGKITGGDAMNIIAQQVRIEGTMRAFSDEVYEEMTRRIQLLSEEIAKGYGCVAKVSFNHMYRVVENDPAMVTALAEIVGDSYQTTPPYMLAEDFSMYQQKVPSLFFFVGIRNESKNYVHPLHSSKMQFDEETLLGGIECYRQLIQKLN